MPSALKERLAADIKSALKGGEKSRLGTLRFISAAIKQQEVDNRIELDDTAVTAILVKLANQRRESIAQFEAAQREDLVAKEREELAIIGTYLPVPLSTDEIDALIDEAVTRLGATTIKDMGRVMNELRPQLAGRADVGAASAKVKARLGA